ncbi:MAG: response regulator [Bacteroidota bacterium]|nr:response regulator [Bacteroidota bacterium]
MHSQQDTSVFFIDDSDTDNFIHQQFFHRYCKNYNYTFFNSAIHALDYIKIVLANDNLFQDKVPEYIFLDLDLPIKSGFEFLDEFEPLNERINHKIKVVILTASFNPADKAKSSTYKSVVKFILKPFTKSSLSGFGLRLKSQEELIINDHVVKNK